MKRQKEPISEEQKSAAEQQIREEQRRCDYYLTEYTLDFLVGKLQCGEIRIPEYQRGFTWDIGRKSKFIESLLMGLPIPFLFFSQIEDGVLDVVDGSQRIRTVEAFRDGHFELSGLETLEQLNGFHFSDLNVPRQRKLLGMSIRGVVLKDTSDPSVQLDLFDRINTSPKVANKAEVRRGAYPGIFMDLVQRCAHLPSLHRLAPVPEKAKKEREYEELVSRFFAYSDGFDGYKDRVAEFIIRYTKLMNEKMSKDPSLVEQYFDRFRSMLDFVERNFPNGFKKSRTATATPRARFEAIAVGSYLAVSLDPAILGSRSNTAWVDGREFGEIAGSDGANVASKLRGRIEFARDQLLAGR